MKKLVWILIWQAVCLSMAAQPFGSASGGYRITHLFFSDSRGEKGTTRFCYDKQGFLTKAYWSKNDLSYSSVNTYSSDSNGNIISASRFYSDSIVSNEVFFYNQAGEKLSEYFFRSDHVSGNALHEYENHRIAKSHLFHYKGWLTGDILYHHHGERLISADIIQNGNLTGHIHYRYDPAGNLSGEIWEIGDNVRLDYTYEYEQFPGGPRAFLGVFRQSFEKYRPYQEFYSFNNEKQGVTEYIYDDRGNLKEKIYTLQNQEAIKTRYYHDMQNRLDSALRFEANGPVSKYQYTYDPGGNLILRTRFSNDSLSGFECYQYNAAGLLESAYVKNLDSWLTGTINYHTNVNGIIDKARFIGNNDIQADIYCKYDAMGLLVEVTWNFSFGKFQQYQYRYYQIHDKTGL